MTLPRIGRAGLVAWLIISSESPALADAKACAADDCPALVRNDCQEWGAAVTEALPSIIVDARDASGHDVGDVLVTMDGELLTKSVNGTAITVDPGPHTFVFTRGAAASVTEKVIIKERARGRTFVVRFDADEDGVAPAPIASPADAAEGDRHHTVGPWIVVGIGGAVAITGAIFYIAAPKVPPNCNEASGSCAASPNEDPSQLTKERSQAGTSVANRLVGLVAMASGAGIVGGGLLWHFLEPTAPRTARLTVLPWTTAEGAGLAAAGAF